MLEVFGIPGGNCLVKKTIRDIRIAILFISITEKMEVTKLSGSFHGLCDKIQAN